jgi:hypothetical protein
MCDDMQHGVAADGDFYDFAGSLGLEAVAEFGNGCTLLRLFSYKLCTHHERLYRESYDPEAKLAYNQELL